MGDTGGGRSSVVLGDDEEEVFGKIKRTVEASRASAQKDPADEDPPDEDFPDDDEPPLLSADEVDAAWEMEPAPAEGASAVESVADDPARAGGWRRGAAAALDLGVSLAALGVAVLVSELLWLRSGGQVSAPLWLLAAVFAGAGWTHTLVGEGLCGGATLGKRALGLRVAVPGGGALPVWRVALRRLCLDALGRGAGGGGALVHDGPAARSHSRGRSRGSGRIGCGGLLRVLPEPGCSRGARAAFRSAAAFPARLGGGAVGGLRWRRGGRRGRCGWFRRPARRRSCRRRSASMGRRDGRGGFLAPVGWAEVAAGPCRGGEGG